MRLALSEFVRERLVVLESLAASATETLTVMMSPTRLARGSWKKLRAPGCHSELAPRGSVGAAGIGRTGSCGVGLLIGANFGPPSISLMRSTAEQAQSAATAPRLNIVFRIFKLMCHIPHCHPRPSDTTVSRGEGDPGSRAAAVSHGEKFFFALSSHVRRRYLDPLPSH